MKHINTSNIENGNFQSHVEYLILKGKSSETLENLGQPETAKQAKEKLSEIISKENKYKSLISLEDEVLYKILFEAFSVNRSVENQLSIFLRQISPKIARARVEASFIVLKIANKTYKNETSTSVFDNAA